MFVLYNASLRGFPAWDVECLVDAAGGPANKYETTIFVIASGIIKLSKVFILSAPGLFAMKSVLILDGQLNIIIPTSCILV